MSDMDLRLHAGILLSNDLLYYRREGALYLQFVKSRSHNLGWSKYEARNFFAHVLLCGSLSQNSQTSLYRSFFHSPIREVLLLTIIAGYASVDNRGMKVEGYEVKLLTEKFAAKRRRKKKFNQQNETEKKETKTKIKTVKEEMPKCEREIEISRIEGISRLLLQDRSNLMSLYWKDGVGEMLTTGSHLELLPLICKGKQPTHLRFRSIDRIDIDFLLQFDLTKLEILSFSSIKHIPFMPQRAHLLPVLPTAFSSGCGSIHSLNVSDPSSISNESPLSLLCLPSLKHLNIVSAEGGAICQLENLNGLSVEITRSLTHFKLVDVPSLSDISALSHFDFSCLEMLYIFNCSVRDWSPLRECAFPSILSLYITASPFSDLSLFQNSTFSNLKSLCFRNTDISDLSSITDWKGFSPSYMSFSGCPIVDVSPLLQIDLSKISKPISFTNTKVSDFSSLEGVVYDIEIYIDDTPFQWRVLKDFTVDGVTVMNEEVMRVGKVRLKEYVSSFQRIPKIPQTLDSEVFISFADVEGIERNEDDIRKKE